ncbi:zinc finger C3H1 domain-containing protein isoform X2 [Amphiprion ocellaris]|uniref:zinc finger C3H1 domain-containing protein isoform X2 n=1 Tax=Amphiprion ocellaris TaxID=80972 RepID=UPI0024119039|nr:zinc finger C3H1 domain-containing protein isoform X2 [Amphiprion ocellaris]
MDLNTKHGSPPEDGELEDGEICDDEAEESVPTRRGDGSRPGGGGAPRSRKTHQHTHGLPPHLGHPLPDLRLMMPYGLGPHLGSFPPNHRQQCGPSGPDRPPAPSPTPALPPGLVPHGEPSPRSSFWERSHGALGRFRHRVVPNGGRGAWSRGGRGGNSRAPPGRYGPGESHGSPQRKQKLLGRNRPRKVLHSMSKPESSMDESFEDLLSKYRQIQLELECIRKEETMALEPDLDQDLVHAGGLQENRTEPAQELDRAEKKVFQAFNIKPLRQKIPSANLDELQRRWAEQDGGDGANAEAADGTSEGGPEPAGGAVEEAEHRTTADGTSVDRPEPAGGAAEEAEHRTCENCGTNKPPCSCCRESSASSEESTSTEKRVEEEELSELQLRLLALQSASKKWQQKEQQVMKKSKERITKAVQDKSSGSGSGPGAAGPGRQRVTTRSASSAAAAERNRTRSNPVDRDRERTKTGTRLPERDRDRPKPPLDWGRVPGKPHVPKKVVSPGETGSAAKQAFRKQQLRTWKLQQQREQEEKRHHEEEERRKREDEIRRIRDLSNQDEQYNRFMKLVGGRRRTRSKSRDRDHRKSAGKAGLDSSGNLYQYDNYDEVAMDTDSETGSPVSSPTPHLLSAEEPGGVPQVSLCDTNTAAAFGMDLSQSYLSPMLSSVPPPPPLPPPPDDLEPPPKPPFADEEEEEEMLLRETCLMSMAHKRVASSETSSGPPSPSCLPPADVQLPPRGNLSTVSLNTVPPSRTKFSRGHHAARAPLVLPRHKAVVVSLNDSDDSDSDLDSCSSTQAVFGGLEFMIKEARRTVEAAKPKAASGCEKENNPVRPPEALPEAKKAEYCLLKEEIASREKQKMKDHSLPPQSSAASDSLIDSSLKPAVELKLAEAEQRLSKHRELLQRDEAVLRHLLQQELKKTESLKAAEAKVSKLKEQLQASERIVTANRTLLKKLQEQVHQVEHRVSMKKSLAVQLGQELLQAQLAAGKGPKRPAEPIQNQPSKLQRLDSAPRGSERHFVELIAQKQRLQQLESEYAQKIQKLKEAQALRNRGLPAEPPPASTPVDRQVAPPAGAFAVPQPSLHDLTQDKLTLDSEDAAEPEEPEPAPAAPSGRRSSLRQSSSSFTKPHLDTPSSAPSKDGGAKLTKTEPPAETSVGLDLDALRRRYQLQARLGDLLLGELQQLGAAVDGAPAGQVLPVEVETAASQSGGSELKPVPFGAYRSPLLAFRSYRFSPYYRTKEKLSLSSVTFSNVIEPNRIFCRFDLTGTCNDDSCSWQHMRNCTLTGNQLFEDILSYNLQLIGCSESSSGEDIGAATEKYMKKLFGSNKDRMGLDQKAVLLVSKVNESRRHVPPFTTCKDMRRWRPKPATQNRLRTEDGSEDEAGHLTPGRADDVCKSSLSTMDVCVTSEDRRYFISETDDISNLESSVQESPRDTQLWIKLAYKYLSQSETSAAESLEAALNTLSRALESNCDDPEVWSHYLTLFSRRGSREEVQEMCEMAVEHAPDRLVWWNVRLQYLTLESSFEGKDYVCERLLHFLQVEASSGVSEKLSFQLMEVLLYRVQLSMFSGRMESALALLQNALKSAQDRSVADLLLPADRVLLWLSFIHLTEFDRLPANLFDPAESGPSRLVSRDAFLLPWRTETDVSTPPDILVALFQDAIRQCSHESDLLACLPLHSNLILLHKLLHRYDEGVSLCESLLQLHPDSCSLRDALADLHLQRGNGEQAVGVWLHALAECPHNAEVFYRCCRFLMAQDQSSAVVPLFRGFVLSFCDDQDSQSTPVDILRVVLGFPSNQLLRGSIIRKELQEQLSQQKSFLHLIHCRWQWLHGSADQTVEAFERALGSTLQLDELHTLWMDYLLFSCSPQASDPARSRRFSDLVQRCLSTVPTRLQVPFNPAEFWSCYRFHNKVVSLYLSCLPPSQHALVLERLRYAMPNNTELGLRLLHQEFQDGSMEQLRFQARMLSSSAPRCLSVWKIAIAVETELKQRSEVRLLYQQAVQHLPLSAALWTHRLLSEAAEGGDWEKVRRLVDLCQQVGVSLSLGEALGPGGRSTDL